MCSSCVFILLIRFSSQSYTGAFLDELEAVFGLRRELPYDMLSHYLVFTKIPRVLPNQLIPRERLTHILYDVFFKTVMPVRWTHPGTVR